MALKTRPVIGTVYLPDGSPAVKARVIAKLNRLEKDGGIVVPQVAQSMTDETGAYSIDLWPNQRGTGSSAYRVIISNAAPQDQAFNIVVPDGVDPVAMESLINLPPYPSVDAAQAAIVEAQAAAASAGASASQADSAKSAAQSSATSAGNSADSANTSAADAIAAKNAAVAAKEDAQDAKTYINNVYYGPLADDPSQRPDGTAMHKGDRYFNTTSSEERTFDGTNWYVANVDGQAIANATDPTKGAAMVGYLPPDTGAYPWDVSEKFSERVSLLNFVPKNKRDGIMNGVEDYDISAAVAAAFSEYEGAGSLELLLPRGAYHLNNRVLTETSFDLSIQGAGANLTKILVTSANGGIELDYSASSGRAHNVQLNDLRIVAGVAGAGTAFKMLESPGGNRHERMFQARNVVLIGFDIEEHYFNNGIVLNGVWRPLFDNVIVSGPFAGATNPQAMTMGIDVTECYSPQFQSSRIWGADKGIVYENTSNPGPEGLWITDSKVVDCNVGVSVSSTGTEPSLQLANSHINSKDACLRVNKWKMLRIFGCLFYASDQATTNSAVLDLTDVQDTISVGNQYHVPSSDTNTKSGIHLNGSCINFKSIGEMFRRFGSEAIRISAGSTNVRIIDPEFIDCAVDVNDLSNNAQIWKDGFMHSFGDGAVSGPQIGTMRKSDSPAAKDGLGLFVSDGLNDAGERVTYAQMRSEISDPSDGEESGRMQIWTSVAGALARQATFGSGGMYVGNTAGDIPAGNSVNAESYYIKGVQVLSDQQSAISDATGGDELVKINAILAALRSHGLIAS